MKKNVFYLSDKKISIKYDLQMCSFQIKEYERSEMLS